MAKSRAERGPQPKNQYNFFSIVPEFQIKTTPPDPTLIEAHQEARLDKLHAKARSKNGLTRSEVVRPDADRDTRAFYKKIGWTEKAKTEDMLFKWNVSMFRLKTVGVYDLVQPNLTHDQMQDIIQKLQEYEREHHMSRRKWTKLYAEQAPLIQH